MECTEQRWQVVHQWQLAHQATRQRSLAAVHRAGRALHAAGLRCGKSTETDPDEIAATDRFYRMLFLHP